MKKLVTLSIAVLMTVAVMANEKNLDKAKAEPKAASEMTVFSGVVVDKETGETLVGVSLKIEGTDQQVFTDFDGKFEVKAFGNATIVSSMPSYKTTKVSEINGEIRIELEAQK
jgi:hypothetical protein